VAAESTSFLIVGGGVAGLGTAWHLARAGHGQRTMLLEAEPHWAVHSSGRNAAILRTLGSDPIGTRIARRSARFLREPPPGFADTPLIDAFGLVLSARGPRADALVSWAETAGDEPCKIEPLSRERLRALAPHFAGEVDAAFWFPEEGRIDIGALVAGFARGVRRGGVAIRRGCRVETLLREGGRVVGVRLDSGEEVRAEVTVVAAGGWASRLGAAAGSRVRLRPTRRHLMVTAPDPAVDRRWPVVWYLGADAASEFYCRPEAGGMLLCACEIADVDPDRFDVDDAVRRQIAAKATRYVPLLGDARAAHFWCGMRTLTGDGRFAVGPDPDLRGLYWVAGLAGAGMVCSAEVGRLAAADLLGQTDEPELMDALRPGRAATTSDPASP
jgi:D-arginine dehydrogenase